MVFDEFTIILPTLNEADNIVKLIAKITSQYQGIFIIVSDDNSKDNIEDLVASFRNPRITFLSRRNAKVRGLSASVLDASRLVKSRYFIVMDADNQHPWEAIQDITSSLKQGANLVIASRKKVDGYWPWSRKYISYMGNTLGKISLLIRKKIYINYDILTGFFGAETGFWTKIIFKENKAVCFRLKGYKVLFDFLKIIPRKTKIKNVWYVFNARKVGASKLNSEVYLEYLKAVFL